MEINKSLICAIKNSEDVWHPKKIINIMKNLYQEVSGRVLLDETSTKMFDTKTVVTQWCVMSGLLINIVIMGKTLKNFNNGFSWNSDSHLEDLELCRWHCTTFS